MLPNQASSEIFTLEMDVIVGGAIGYMISWFVLSLWIRVKLRELKKGKTWVWYENHEPEFKKIS